jgi:hypothetical protein
VSDCRERAYRANLSDAEFWDYALLGIRPEDAHDGPDGPDLDDDRSVSWPSPCAVCGECGPCGFDAEGLPLVHADAARQPDDDGGAW